MGDDDSAVLALGNAIPLERRIIVFDITEEIGRIRADFAGALAAQDPEAE